MKKETKEQPLLVQIFAHDTEPKTNILSVFLDCDKNVFSETLGLQYESKADPAKEDFAVIEKALEAHKIEARIETQSGVFYHGTWNEIKGDSEK